MGYILGEYCFHDSCTICILKLFPSLFGGFCFVLGVGFLAFFFFPNYLMGCSCTTVGHLDRYFQNGFSKLSYKQISTASCLAFRESKKLFINGENAHNFSDNRYF